MTLALRDYQTKAVTDIRSALHSHDRVLFVGPCGMGKTQLFVFIAKSAAGRGNRIYILVHRRELIRQTSRTLDAWGVRHGVVAPGHSMTDDLVQVASVATLGRRLDRAPPPKLIVVDECHHAISPTYRKILQAWPAAKALGVTASPERLDGIGLGDVFGAMVLGPGVRDLIQAGWLSQFDYFAPPAAADLSAIKTEMGDYSIGQLAAAMDRATITGDCIEHVRRLAPTEPALVFCVSVQHAHNVAEAFRRAGFAAAAVDGTMDVADRDRIILGLARGTIQVVTSCALITEGFDCPAVSTVVLLRPTKSLQLQVQMVGRAFRPKPDGGRAVILDHVGNCGRHGMPDEPRAWSLDGKKARAKPAPVRTCRTCYATFGAPSIAACRIDDAACPMLADAPAAAPGQPETVAGELERLVDPLAWAGGIDVLRAFGGEYRALIERADTPEKLLTIARIRRCKRGWVEHILRARSQDAAA